MRFEKRDDRENRYSRDNSYNRDRDSSYNRRYSRDSSGDRYPRPRTPERSDYNNKTRVDSRERLNEIVCFKCNEKGHYSSNCNNSKND